MTQDINYVFLTPENSQFVHLRKSDLSKEMLPTKMVNEKTLLRLKKKHCVEKSISGHGLMRQTRKFLECDLYSVKVLVDRITGSIWIDGKCSTSHTLRMEDVEEVQIL